MAAGPGFARSVNVNGLQKLMSKETNISGSYTVVVRSSQAGQKVSDSRSSLSFARELNPMWKLVAFLPCWQPRCCGAHQLAVLQSQVNIQGEISGRRIGDVAVRCQFTVNMSRFDGYVPQLSQRSIGKPAAHSTTGSNDQRDSDWVAQHEHMAGPFAHNGRRHRGGPLARVVPQARK